MVDSVGEVKNVRMRVVMDGDGDCKLLIVKERLAVGDGEFDGSIVTDSESGSKVAVRSRSGLKEMVERSNDRTDGVEVCGGPNEVEESAIKPEETTKVVSLARKLSELTLGSAVHV